MILIILSCVLMMMDHQFSYFDRARSTLSFVVAPLQYFVDRPVGFVRWLETSFMNQQNLLVENAQLRARELLLYAKLQKVVALEHENDQLRALLKSASNIHEKVTVAQTMAVDLAPYTQQIIIDKGKKDGVYVGQPVLDAFGVMGQVIAVGPMNSRVLLITDPRSAVPVQNSRNGNRAIAVGFGFDGVLGLINVPFTIDFRKGDVLVTSGLGGNYPPGYPLGVINYANYSQGERFAKINVTPAAHVNQSRQVLLVWPKIKTSLTDTVPQTTPLPKKPILNLEVQKPVENSQIEDVTPSSDNKDKDDSDDMGDE